MRPVIGMLSVVNDECVTSVVPTYAAAIEAAGGLPLLLPYVTAEATFEEFAALCDGFLFAGGADIDPKHYGEQPKPTCGAIQPYRDEVELRAFEKAFATGKPIVGVCRGLQLINVALGGTLYQDIPSEIKTDVRHQQLEDRFAPSHEVNVHPATPLFDLVGVERLCANSFHHQSIKTLGKGLAISATADDGVVEAVYWKGERYLRAYQWHPERLKQSEKNKLVFDEFIAVCKKEKEKEYAIT